MGRDSFAGRTTVRIHFPRSMRDGATTLWGVNSSNLSTPDRQTFIERHLILRQQGRSWSARHPGGKAPG